MSRTWRRSDTNKDRLYNTEPKKHRNMHKHRPRRRAVKQAIHKVERGEEDVLFPLDKKPWEYYW